MFGFSDDSMASYYAEQGFDAMLQGEEDDEPQTKRCRYCRKDGFHWAQLGGRWRLFTAHGRLHSCARHKFEKGTP